MLPEPELVAELDAERDRYLITIATDVRIVEVTIPASRARSAHSNAKQPGSRGCHKDTGPIARLRLPR
jgi:hypothetical protein